MSEKSFEPSTVTKPIQLLAAWLIGLIVVNGTFLTAARLIEKPDCAAGFLVICAALCVPMFLGALFLLQTKFRPEMQEDSFYARHLERLSSQTAKVEFVTTEQEVKTTPIRAKQRRVRQNNRTFSSDIVQISVNDLLDNFDDIVKEIKNIGLSVSDTFGSTSIKANVPTQRLISVGYDVDLKLIKQLLKSALHLKFDKISLSEEGFSYNRVYFGSYSYESEPEKVKTFDNILLDKILSANSWDELSKLIGS